MCELLAMSCRYPARLTHSLANLASRALPPSSNRDGWGVAFYQGVDIALYRDTQPATESLLLQWLSRSSPATRTAIGYIRHGTQGGVTLANTAPFVRELNGRMHTFVHNGNLRCSGKHLARQTWRFQPLGQTDSELAFCELMENIASLSAERSVLPALARRMEVVSEMAALFRQCGPSNFIYSDGDVVFVHADQRFQKEAGIIAPPALYLFECISGDVPGLVCEAEPSSGEAEQRVMMLATVPLSAQHWEPLERGRLLALREGEIVATANV